MKAVSVLKLNPRQVLLVITLAIICGNGMRSYFDQPIDNFWLMMTVLVIIATAVLVNFKFKKISWTKCFLILFLFMASLLQYEFSLRRVLSQELAFADKSVNYHGIIFSHPREFPEYTLLTINAIKNQNQPIVGRVNLQFYGVKQFSQGDQVFWKCKIQPTKLSFLLLNNISGQCKVFDAEIISRSKKFFWVAKLQEQFSSRIRQLMPEPEASFMLGLLSGDRDGIPGNLRDNFKNTGVSHILAISGYNISQIALVLSLVLASLCLRATSSVIAIILIGFFAFFTGGSASVLRAAIMGGVALVARIFGRRYSGIGAIAFAAAIMLAFNPFLLRYDLGFQLSFMAALSISVYQKFFQGFFAKLIKVEFLNENLSTTLAATVGTFPIILHSFKFLPFISLITNVAIAPFIPLAMIFGGLAFMLSFISFGLARLLSLPAYFILRIIELIVGFFARWPLALRYELPFFGVVIWYIILAGCAFWINKKGCIK